MPAHSDREGFGIYSLRFVVASSGTFEGVTTSFAASVWRLGTDQFSATMKAHPVLRATQYFLSEFFTSFVYPVNATKQCLFAKSSGIISTGN
jgi:hypothetical protein